MRLNVTICPGHEKLLDFVQQLPHNFGRQGKIISTRRQIKAIAAPDGTVLNVKRYRATFPTHHTPPPPPQSRAVQAYNYSHILQQRGIITPVAVACVEQHDTAGLLGDSYLVMLPLNLRYTLCELANSPEGAYEELAYQLGQFTANMHEQQVLHMSYKPANILWDRDDTGYHFAIVDINNVKLKPVRDRQGCETLRQLWGPKRFVELTARSYAQHRNIDETQAVEWTLQARKRYWNSYQRHHKVTFPLEL